MKMHRELEVICCCFEHCSWLFHAIHWAFLCPWLFHAIHWAFLCPLILPNVLFITFLLFVLMSSPFLCADLDMCDIRKEAPTRWLRPNEIHAILCNYKHFSVNVKPVNLPKSTSIPDLAVQFFLIFSDVAFLAFVCHLHIKHTSF